MNRIKNENFKTIIKDKDLVKKTKEKRQRKINHAVELLHEDDMWTTTERVDSILEKIMKKIEHN